MATAEQTQALVQYTVGMFGIAPGGFESTLESIVDSGLTPAETMTLLGDNADLMDVVLGLGGDTTDGAFLTALLDNLLGASVSAETLTLATTVCQELLDAGVTRGQLMTVATDFIAATDPADAAFGQAQQQLENRI
ncbi:MAG: hypothetical protein RQ754_15265, partial [Desulfuromonadales bacterium]|nr:hypothetical protein [Desulfuromonadales bacterium]